MRAYRGVALAIALFVAAVASAGPVMAQQASEPVTVYAADVEVSFIPDPSGFFFPTTNALLTFSSDDPEGATSEEITGLEDGEAVVGLDFRPLTGMLYALTDGSQLYTIDPASAEATAVGEPFDNPELDGESFGFDFNPSVDRIRVVADSGQNLRLDPNTGGVAMEDGDLNYAADDANSAESAAVVAAGYSNNEDQTGRPMAERATTLFVVDSELDVLAIQDPPNEGVLRTVGALGEDVGPNTSIDVVSASNAFAAHDNDFSTLNLSTGELTLIGTIEAAADVTALAVSLGPDNTTDFPDEGEQVFVATELNRLIEFNSGSPETDTAQTLITGLGLGQTVAALDFRPATGELYALSSDDIVFTIDPDTGRATRVSSAEGPELDGELVGFDFNPSVDRIRLVTDAGENFRLEPESGTVSAEDGDLAYAAGDPGAAESMTVTDAAYTENFASVMGTPTQLFVLDTGRDALALQNPPNDGVLNSVGDLGVDAQGPGGFDVAQSGQAFAALTIEDTPIFGTVNLMSGAFTAVGEIDAPEGITAMAVETNVSRLFGLDRFETAAQLSRQTFEPGVDTVFIATGQEFADALAGGPPGAMLGAPILLVTQTELPPVTATELDRLNPGEIVVLGGPVAVGQPVFDRLGEFTDGEVRRIEGQNRFETAAQIARTYYESDTAVAYVATGQNFPDALAGGPAAFLEGGPVVLVTPSEVTGPTEAVLRELEPQRIVVLGGNEAVNEPVGTRLDEFTEGVVERRAGQNRFDTAAIIADESFAETATSTVYVTTGAKFPDALATVPLTGQEPGAILLVELDRIPAETEAILGRLEPDRIVIVGGPAVVNDAVARRLETFARNDDQG